MHWRILAGLGAAIALVGAFASPLGGEPASSTTPARPGTTTTLDPLDHLPPDSPINPLRVYPRRPGAKYDDSEAAPNAEVTIGGARLRVASAAVVPRNPQAKAARPMAKSPYKTLGLVDGYAPYVVNDPGDVLHVVVHAIPDLFPVSLTCVATAATDGTVLVPYLPSTRPPPPASDAKPYTAKPVEVGFDFPLGARRGRFFLTCVNSLLLSGQDVGAFFQDYTHAVWAVDV